MYSAMRGSVLCSLESYYLFLSKVSDISTTIFCASLMSLIIFFSSLDLMQQSRNSILYGGVCIYIQGKRLQTKFKLIHIFLLSFFLLINLIIITVRSLGPELLLAPNRKLAEGQKGD